MSRNNSTIGTTSPLWEYVKNGVIPIIIAVFAAGIPYGVNDYLKRKEEAFVRKEQRYANLLQRVNSFDVVHADDNKTRDEFIQEFHLCWLYCPDEVIQKGNAFLDSVNEKKKHVVEPEIALGEFVLAIRQDLFRDRCKKTQLQGNDFEVLNAKGRSTATPQPSQSLDEKK